MDTNFNQKQNEEHESTVSSQNTTATEFATVEAAIGADRELNPPPPEIAERLNQSLANEPKRGTSFWTKLGFRK